MKLFTKEIERRLDANAIKGGDNAPVVKLFTPWGGATWLITERNPCDPNELFGLCDLGLGTPELGYVNLSELAALKGPFGLRVERDQCFKADRQLSKYADAARAAGKIVS